jgi:hypothetical protein
MQLLGDGAVPDFEQPAVARLLLVSDELQQVGQKLSVRIRHRPFNLPAVAGDSTPGLLLSFHRQAVALMTLPRNLST